MAFSIALGAEMSALENALREDVPDDLDEVTQIIVRSTKNANRTAYVSVASDEQRTLLRYAIKHAQGTNGHLFGPSLSNLQRALADASTDAGIPHASPHDLRRTGGQWLIDLGASLELVSRFMRHADSKITETVYARIKDEDVADRTIDSIGPRYARVAHRARRGTRKLIETLKSIPKPKASRETLYRVGDVERSLTGWAQASGIAKTTLHHRVVTSGLTMEKAIARLVVLAGNRWELERQSFETLPCRCREQEGLGGTQRTKAKKGR